MAGAVLAATLGGLLWAVAPTKNGRSVELTGTQLPDGQLTDVSGTRELARRAIVGPAVVLYVSSTCSHCKRELASWGQVISRCRGFRSGSVRLAIVVAGTKAPDGSVPVAARILFDPGAELHRRLGGPAVPLTLYVDGNGVIRYSVVGAQPATTTLSRLRQIEEAQCTTP